MLGNSSTSGLGDGKRRPRKVRRLLLAATLVAGVAALTLPFAASSESGTHNRLSVNVVATNRGPLPACDGTNCTPANFVQHFIYVENKNDLANRGGTRATLPNAFVVSSVDESIFVDGVDTFDFTITPPPNPGDFGFLSGHWPSTVTCTPGVPPPCNVVGSPAILPSENTAVLYVGWFHGDQEPNGTYVFTFTVHGTLNGTPVDLTASSQPIEMTPQLNWLTRSGQLVAVTET